MSKIIGVIKSSGKESMDMQLCRFYGGHKRGKCIQISIGDKHCELDKEGVEKLKKLLSENE